MTPPIILCAIVALFIFYIGPQLSKFRSITGIGKQLKDGELSRLQKFQLMILGLKTPFINTLALIFSFLSTESSSLMQVDFDKFISHEYAELIASGLWVLSLWSHFSGLNAAAAMPPAAPKPPVGPED